MKSIRFLNVLLPRGNCGQSIKVFYAIWTSFIAGVMKMFYAFIEKFMLVSSEMKLVSFKSNEIILKGCRIIKLA